MDLLEFCQSIASPALRAVALHWLEARGSKRMPSWQDIKPKAIAPYLPFVWSYKFDSAAGDFIGRLAGNSIAQAYGRSFRGLPLSEIHSSPERYQTTFAMFERAITEPAIFRGTGRVFRLKDKFESGERIVLPLSENGVEGDSVFGATESGGLPVIRDQPVEAFHDIGDWFSLK